MVYILSNNLRNVWYIYYQTIYAMYGLLIINLRNVWFAYYQTIYVMYGLLIIKQST